MTLALRGDVRYKFRKVSDAVRWKFTKRIKELKAVNWRSVFIPLHQTILEGFPFEVVVER